MSYHRKGYSLLVVMVLLALGGFGLQQLAKNGHFAHLMLLEQKVRQNQILDETKASLLGFAGSQGIHSQSHLGHLPCPADLPDQAPKTTCLNKPWGYLPARSSFSTACSWPNVRRSGSSGGSGKLPRLLPSRARAASSGRISRVRPKARQGFSEAIRAA